MKKVRTYQLLLLPTDKAGSLYTHINKLIFARGAKQGKAPETSSQLLCAIADANDEVKDGDWYASTPDGVHKGIFQAGKGYKYNSGWHRKIIASIDKSITPKSWIPESFVKAYVKSYNESNQVREINLEMTYTIDKSLGHFHQSRKYFIKTRPDDSVITSANKTYSGTQVKQLITKFLKFAVVPDGNPELIPSKLDEWAETNI